MRQRTILTSLSFMIVITAFGCGDKIEPGTTTGEAARIVTAQVVAASTNSRQSFYEAVGTVGARTTSTLSSKIMGVVKAIHVWEGDMVEKDDLLVKIDDRQPAARLRQAEAGLAEARRALESAKSARDAAEAGADLARATHDRYSNLLKEESVSQQEYDEVDARYRQANASFVQADAMVEAAANRVEQAEAGVESARTMVKDATIRAPYKGTVTAKMVDVGDMAAPGTPLLGLEQKGVFCVSLVVPEIHIRTVALGDQVNVTIPSMEDSVVQGKIGRIDPAADQQSRSFIVKVALPDGHDYRSGIFARVALPVGEAGMLLVPKTALIYRGQLTGFYLVDDRNIARFRLLRTGRMFGESVEVLSGMKDGDRYVVLPPPDMEDGAKVEVAS